MALSPAEFALTEPICPVSPRVVWTNRKIRHVQSEKDLHAALLWRQWMLLQHARSCQRLPALVHLLVVLIVTFHSNLRAAYLSMRPLVSSSEPVPNQLHVARFSQSDLTAR